MTATETALIPSAELNTAQRFFEARVETFIPGIFLTIVTSHSGKSYWSRLDRVQISEGILTMKIDAARFTDLAPVTQRKVAAARYSVKNLQAAHEAFTALVEPNLADALAWAERF